MLYAAKANDTPKIIEALVEAGIRSFDVASLVEIERVAPIPDAELYFMNPVKSRGAIARAYRAFGVRSFAFDSDEELDKIVEETGGAEDLTLFLRVACPNTHSLIPLEGKFGVSREEAPQLCCGRGRSRSGSASPSMSDRRPSCRPRSARRWSRSAN